MNIDNLYYVYVYLRTDIPGNFNYGEITFNYQPFYVGKGYGDRMKQGLYGKSLKAKLYKQLKSNNHGVICLKIKECLSEESAYELEVEIIKLIGLSKNGGSLVNITNGGAGGGIGVHKYKFRSVYMFDCEGVLLKEYESIKEAALDNKVNVNNISRCCRGIWFTVDNKIFRYTDEFDSIPNNIDVSFLETKTGSGPVPRKVIQKNMVGELINVFSSIKEASEKTGAQKSKIVSCCKNIRKQTNGYKWEYAT